MLKDTNTYSITQCSDCPFYTVEGMEHMMYCNHPVLKAKDAPGYPYAGAIISYENSRGRVPNECPLRKEPVVSTKLIRLKSSR